jgi:hypothetical protein
MPDGFGLPASLQINAFSDLCNQGPIDPNLFARVMGMPQPLPNPNNLPIISPDFDPLDPEVGFGLVVKDDPGFSIQEKLDGDDLTSSAKRLLQARKGVVLRYNAGAPVGTLRRYLGNDQFQDQSIALPIYGIAPGQIPRYLLILGSPIDIPWRIQFSLQSNCLVGRLDLTEEALSRYVTAVLGNTGTMQTVPSALIWSAVNGANDITALMRNCIAKPIAKRIKERNAAATLTSLGLSHIGGQAGDLIDALRAERPNFVTTTSHGMTGPVGQPQEMRTSLGVLVDSNQQLLDPSQVLSNWSPEGAFWYSHACCSAGSNSNAALADYVAPNTPLFNLLKSIAVDCDDMIAPFPTALLSAEKPLLGFIGHVEPTFNWSLQQPNTGQWLSLPLVNSIVTEFLEKRKPIGLALEACRRLAANVVMAADANANAVVLGGNLNKAGEIMALRLIGHDWNSMVLLGDPVAGL